MPVYSVQIVAEFYKDYEIEASNEYEARDEALEKFNLDVSNDWDSFHIEAVKELTEWALLFQMILALL